MSAKSSIEWTDTTWNPLVGCSMVSAGCVNCYAIRTAFRQEMMHQNSAYKGLTVLQPNGKRNWTGEVRILPERLTQPLQWKTPRRVFVNSTSDLFHPDVPFEFVEQVFAIMLLAKRHTFQILTKRPERMAEFFARPNLQAQIKVIAFTNALRGLVKNPEDFRHYYPWPLPNVWLGTSVEDQKTADERIPHLLEVLAKVRFLSCEPLLGPVNLAYWFTYPPLRGLAKNIGISSPHAASWKPPIHWTIVGGESGPGARSFCIDWARQIVSQCKEAGVPVFVKQLGARPYYHFGGDVPEICDDPIHVQLRNKKGGDMEEWVAALPPEIFSELRAREFPTVEGVN